MLNKFYFYVIHEIKPFHNYYIIRASFHLRYLLRTVSMTAIDCCWPLAYLVLLLHCSSTAVNVDATRSLVYAEGNTVKM